MKIGILKETKKPEDNRVALTPSQIKYLSKKYPKLEFIVQSSDIRAFGDIEYEENGIKVQADISDCDILFGIKEADIESLIENKHYFFFGHIAKMQSYNKPLIKKMIDLKITFTDYEYLVDESGDRLTAFGWWAGVVGAYNSLRAYGLKENLYNLKKPNSKCTLEELLIETNKNTDYSNRIVITGKGRSSQGAQYVLNKSGYIEISNDDFLKENYSDKLVYTVAYLDTLVSRKDNNQKEFNQKDFRENPELYKSEFIKYAKVCDTFIACHFWGNNDPIYLTERDLKDKDIKIKVIGDVTCDILGSIKSTLRASTHNNPFYDYNPQTMKEEKAFSSKDNITVMAVDTLPNALPRDTSEFFGKAIIDNIIDDIVDMHQSSKRTIDNATILRDGELTESFSYLADYADLVKKTPIL